MIDTILKIWGRIETALIGIAILSALAVFLGGAAIRVLFPTDSIDWAEEVALYFIIWATALSGSSLVAEGRHIHTEVFVGMLRPKLRHALGWAMTALSTAFCITIMIYGWQAYEFAGMLDERSASSLRTPQDWTVFLSLPVGMALIVGRVGLMIAAGRRPFAGDGDALVPGKH